MSKEGQSTQPPKNNPVQRNTLEGDIFLEKHKMPIIISLSIPIVAILSLIVILLMPSKNSDQDQPSEGSEAVAITYSEYVDDYKHEMNALYEAAKDSDTQEETRIDSIQKLTDLANEKYATLSEKVYAADTIAKLYMYTEPRDYNEAVAILEETLAEPDLNSYQKTNLLGRLEEVYRNLGSKELLIDTIHRIMDTPADSSYTTDFKTLNDKNLSAILKELER